MSFASEVKKEILTNDEINNELTAFVFGLTAALISSIETVCVLLPFMMN